MNKLLDLGAHTFEGINHLLHRGIIDSSYGIYSFEPNPTVYNKALKKLEENAKKFQYLNLYDYAVGNKDEEVVFHLDESKVSEACNILDQPPNLKELWQRPEWNWTQINVKCISAKTLFELCDIQANDYVKIKCDIEGYEGIVFQEIKSVIATQRPFVQLEISEENKTQLLALFNELDYLQFGICDAHFVSEEGVQKEEGDYFFVPKEKLKVFQNYIS